MNVPATLKHSFLLCLFAAAVPLRAIPAPMQVTAATPARSGDRTRHGHRNSLASRHALDREHAS